VELRRKGWQRKSLAVLVGIVGTFLLLEGGLWTASLFFKPPDRAALLAPAPGERRIVCIGDSNTYGVYLKPEESYPAQLQGFLDLAPGNPWRVVNLGFPGQNSAQVRGRLAENLSLYRAEILIVLIGVNNSWSPAMSHLWQIPDREPSPSFFAGIVQKCRTIGLARMAYGRLRNLLQPARAQREGARVVPGLAGVLRGEGAGEVGALDDLQPHFASPNELRRSLAVDFARIRRICADHGTRLVLVTYPIEVPFVLRDVNPSIRSFAEENHTPLVDLEKTFIPLLAKLGREALQFSDAHATADGNYEVARLVLQTMIDSGTLEERREWRDVLPLETKWRPFELRLRDSEGRYADVDLAGLPRSEFQLTLEVTLVDATGAELPREPRPLRYESLSDEERMAYFGKLDDRGELSRRITLPDLAHAGAPPDGIGVRRTGWHLTARFVPPAKETGRQPETRSVDIPVDAAHER
jgi:hypothetical protein